MFWLFFFLSLFKVACGPTLKLVSLAKKTKFFFIGRWNCEETCEIRKFENAIWESNFDTMGYVWMGRWKYRKQNFSVFQQRALLHIPKSFRTGWLLQKQLMAQEVIIVFDQIVKQNLSYVPCQLMRYLLLKIFMQAKVVCRYWLSENWSLCGSSLWGSMVPKFHFRD